MNIELLINRTKKLVVRTSSISKRLYSTPNQSESSMMIGSLKVEEQPVYKEEPKIVPEDIEKMRLKSSLRPDHRRVLNDEPPHDEDLDWFHSTEKYRRRMLGKYGMKACRMTPGVAWPKPEEVEDKKEYERVLYGGEGISYILNGWKSIAEKHAQEKKEIMDRQEYIDRQMQKMNDWKQALRDKVDKKAAELQAAKEKKEKLMEEIRAHFGFNIDPKDERFKAMLEQKEKEDKKRKKEAKKQKKSDILMEKLLLAEKEMKAKQASEEEAVEPEKEGNKQPK